jgi:hypothetical protein
MLSMLPGAAQKGGDVALFSTILRRRPRRCHVPPSIESTPTFGGGATYHAHDVRIDVGIDYSLRVLHELMSIKSFKCSKYSSCGSEDDIYYDLPYLERIAFRA